MNALTETVVCGACGALDDRLTHELGPGSSDASSHSFVAVAPAPCVRCEAASSQLRPWVSGEPCPSCGRPLAATGPEEVLWD